MKSIRAGIDAFSLTPEEKEYREYADQMEQMANSFGHQADIPNPHSTFLNTVPSDEIESIEEDRQAMEAMQIAFSEAAYENGTSHIRTKRDRITDGWHAFMHSSPDVVKKKTCWLMRNFLRKNCPYDSQPEAV